MPEFANKTNNVFNNVTSVETPGSIDDVIQILERADESGANVRAVGSNWSLSDVAQTNDVWIDLKENMGGVKELKAGDIHIGETEILSNIIPSIQTPASGLHISVPYRSYVYLEGGATVKGVYSELEDLAVDPEAGDGSLIPGAWALWGTGASSGQTIVGAFSTGTHGGDYRLPPIADMVRALRVITAGGEHLWIEPAKEPGR